MSSLPAANRSPSGSMFGKGLAIGAAAYALLWPAILNGYPTVFHDSAGYLYTSVELHTTPRNPLTYGFFMRLVSLSSSPWLVAIAQALITAFVLYEICEYVMRHASPRKVIASFTAVIALLAIASGAPWFTGLLMPDIFAPIQLLCLFLLVYQQDLSRAKMIVLACLLGFCTVVHLANILVLAGMVLLLLLLRMFRFAKPLWPVRSWQSLSAAMLIPIIPGILFICSANWAANFGFRTSPAGYPLMFARLLESGLAVDYLHDACKVESFVTCKYLDHLPRSRPEFLWTSYPLLNEMGGWTDANGEAKRIVLGTVAHAPVRFAAECVKQMFRQFVTFRFEEASLHDASIWTVSAVQDLRPGDLGMFMKSQQMKGRLEHIESKFEIVGAIAFWCGLAVSCLLALVRRTRALETTRLTVLTLLFLFVNAFVTGAFSHVENRYQGRVAWLALLCGTLSLTSLFQQRRLAVADSNSAGAPGRAFD